MPAFTQGYTYDLKDYDVTIVPEGAGAAVPLNIEGGDKDKFKAKRNSPYWKQMVDTDGVPTQFPSNDDTGEISILLTQSSRFNAVMQALIVDKLIKYGPKKALSYTITIRHRVTGDGVFGRMCRLSEQPEKKGSTEPGTNEWKFIVGQIFMLELGANQEGGV